MINITSISLNSQLVAIFKVDNNGEWRFVQNELREEALKMCKLDFLSGQHDIFLFDYVPNNFSNFINKRINDAAKLLKA